MEWSFGTMVLLALSVSALIGSIAYLIDAVFSSVVFGGKKEKKLDLAPVVTCALCKRTKEEVSNMVAGESGYLCSDCLIDSALLLDNASLDKDKEVRFIHHLLIAALCKSSESGDYDDSLKDYILEGITENPEQRIQTLTIINSHKNTHLIIDYLVKIPREHWTFKDIIFWTYANISEGRFLDSLNHPEVKREDQTDSEFRLFTVNRIVAKLEMEPERDEIVQYLADLDSMRTIYRSDDYPLPQDELHLIPSVLGTMAKCHYLLGNYNEALACLNEEIVSSRPSSYRELLHGDVLVKLGQIDEAKSRWQKGVEFDEKNISHEHLLQRLKLLDA